jgi:hypothetical protein
MTGIFADDNYVVLRKSLGLGWQARAGGGS